MDEKDLLIGGGHGGNDTGAIGINNTYEKYLNLTLSMLVYEKIIKFLKSRKTYLLRKDDTYISLNDRCKYANKIAPIYWFEFHFNAYNEKAKGIEIFTSEYTSKKNKEFAAYLCKEFSKLFGIKNRGAQTRLLSSGKDYYYLHRNTNANVTTFIIEPGFIDNVEDFKIISMDNFMDRASTFFAKSILGTIYGIEYVIEKPSNKLYVVQAGAFSQKENAENRVKVLKSHGIDSIIKTIDK